MWMNMTWIRVLFWCADTCADDFTDTNCYFQDGCNHVICGYHDCSGTFHEDIRGKLEREHREIQKYRTACIMAP